MTIVVDGQAHAVRSGQSLLQALRKLGISVPGLCCHPALEAAGRCGLCVVAVVCSGALELHLACLLQIAPDLKIFTTTAPVRQARASVARLLLRHAPFADQRCEDMLRRIIAENTMDVLNPESAATLIGETGEVLPKGCFLCGLCVAICRTTGGNRLVYLGRGPTCRIGYAATQGATDPCRDCLACQRICPSGFISGHPRQVFPPACDNR